MKQYDYWLIVWKRHGEEFHQPVNFQVGAHPEDWCKAISEKSGESYEIHRLVLA